MSQEINAKALAEAIIRHREARKLTGRAASAEMENVSPSTLSRIERGNLPDLDTYMRICRWLNVDPAHFAITPTGRKTTEMESPLQREDIITHLRADKLLSKQTREALITMIEVAYAAARRNILPDESQIPPSLQN
ncbi:helix-turn-helix domain-containing protein [Hymenobacter sp. DH14]|uniref:Helix-turn-helix domain-containing protein n=1 Tax=Hymenobacter cyanobacteriorum TaxID=2926463 RepID=A0A9X1VKH8_9BACT|nr:helix-turn-helix transcriptional regulator [Hymenobacter cyanobacteriorum]MCI1189888.1 helix-turn-helix domain-containing protein [Hymenobacter cyanobacteriorum]